MSKPEPPPLPQSTPSQFPAPPAPPQQKPLPQAVVEYITAFDKPLTKDEKVAWLGEIAHRVLNGELPQEAYPFLRDKIEGLPEALPSPNRPEEKIPGSDYVHPTGSKPYVALIRENPTFKSTDLSSTRTTSRSKANDSSFSTLVGIILFFVVCGIAYAVGSWYMKSPSIKNDAEIASVADDVVPVKVEIKTDNPFAEESAKEITTDNPFEDGTLETKTDNPFADGSGANNNPHFDPETKIYTYEAEEAKLLGGLQVLTSHPGGLPSTGYTGKGYVENFRERDDICVFDVFIEEDGYYDLDFVSASLNGLFKMNRIILDEKSLGEVKVESKIFTSSRMDRIFLTQGSHSIKYAHTWGHVALDKLVISPSGQTNTMATDNPFEDPIATIKELEKEVFRLTLKLDETGKCSYKIERTKKPLSENYEGQVIDVFPNAKSWRAKDGTVTTIHDFSKHVSLDDLFLPRDDKSKERLSLEKSTGRLMMQYGPGLYWDGGCTANYAKKMLLPIEVVVDVAEIEVRDKSFGSDFIIFYGTENTSLRFVFNGAQMYVNRAEQNTSEKTIYHHNCRDFQAEGSFDFPKTEITRAFSFGFQSFTGQKRTGKNGLSMIVTKGRFFDGESNASDTDNPFDEPVATDNPFAE